MMEKLPDDGTIEEIKSLVEDFESQRGMLTWVQQKKMAADPSRSIPFVSTLVHMLRKEVKGANKIHKAKSYVSIIPMLHMLHYAVLQAGVMMPHKLYQSVNECLKELLKMPLPYSAVARSTLKSTVMEINTPGAFYWKKVLAEQSLKTENFTQQEEVFVFADPAVFSDSMEATIKAYLKVSDLSRSPIVVEKQMIMHVLQAGLEQSQRARLASALEALDEAAVKTFFKELNLAVSQSSQSGTSACEEYLNARQRIYREVMEASPEGSSQATEEDRGFLSSNTLPYPHFKFILWNNEEQLWNELVGFTLRSNSQCNDEEEDANTRRDSGIEKDMKDNSHHETQAPGDTNQHLQRRKALKHQESREKLRIVSKKIQRASIVSPEVRRTARVVFLGDDRVLGKLTRAYHSLRKRESKNSILTKNLNLQLYYIPVTDGKSSSPCSPPAHSFQNDSIPTGNKMSLASHLAEIDPWYKGNILSLGDLISNPLEGPSDSDQPSELNLYMLDTLSYYLRCGTQPAKLPVYSVKITFEGSKVVDEVFVSHLHVDIPGSRPPLDMPQKKRLSNRRRSSNTPVGAVALVTYKKLTGSQRGDEISSSPRTFGVEVTSAIAPSTSGQDFLLVDFDCLDPEYKGIRVKHISVQAIEDWRFTLCLDRDSCSIYHQVQRIDVTPCLDPGCNIRTLLGTNRERLLSKYLDKVLSLPINTFSGVSA